MANSTGGQVTWILDADDSQLRSGLARAKAEVADFASATDKATSQGSSSFSGLGATITKTLAAVGLAEAAKQFVSFGVSSASGLQVTSTNMQLLIGNTTQANAVLGQLYQFSRGTPFAFPDVANAAKTLLQFGINANDVVGVTKTLGSVVAVTGTNYQNLAEVYGRVNAAGKVQLNDIQQLTQDGVPVLAALSKTTGKSFQDLSAAFQAGGVNAKAFNAAIQNIAPPDALNQLANTLPTRLSALQGALRSLAFAFLGINIDPVKGFVVEAGGLFDQLSTFIANLAKGLRNPEIQTAFAQLGATINAIGSAALPVLAGGLSLVTQNLNVIIPAALGLAAAFAIIKIGGLVTSLIELVPIMIELIPEIGGVAIAMGILAVLTGGAVFAAFQKFEQQVKQTISTAIKSASQVVDAGNQTQKGVNSIGSAAAELSSQQKQQLSDIAASVTKTNRDYAQSLADILKTHQDTINQLKQSTLEENNSFNASQGDKADSFNQSMADMLLSHNQNTADIQKNLDQETAKGRFADAQRVQDLQQSLAKENAAYAKSTADKQAQYDKDTADAVAQHQAKLTDLQTQLQAETDFLNKHVAQLQGIRASDALDELSKLQQSHTDQLAEYAKQGARVVSTSSDTGTQAANAQSSAFQTILDAGTFNNLGKQAGDDLKSTLLDSLKTLPKDLTNFFSSPAFRGVAGLLSPATAPVTDTLSSLLGLFKGLIPGFAGGIESFGGGLAYVHQGEVLANLAPGTTVIPKSKVEQAFAGGGAGVTQHNTFVVQNNADMVAYSKTLGWQVANA